MIGKKQFTIAVVQYWPIMQIIFVALSIGATIYHLLAMLDEEFTHYHDENVHADTFTWADLGIASSVALVFLGFIYNTSRHGVPENAVANHKFSINNSVGVMSQHADKLLVKARALAQLTNSDMSQVIEEAKALRGDLKDIRMRLNVCQVPMTFKSRFWMSFLRSSLSLALGTISFVMTTFHESAEVGNTEIAVGTVSLVGVLMYSLYLTRTLNYLLAKGPTEILKTAFFVENAQRKLMSIHAALLAALKPSNPDEILDTIEQVLSDKAAWCDALSQREKFKKVLASLKTQKGDFQDQFNYFLYLAYASLKTQERVALEEAVSSHAEPEVDRLSERLMLLSHNNRSKKCYYILSIIAWCMAQGLMSANAILSIIRTYRPLEEVDWAIGSAGALITTLFVGKLNHMLWKAYNFHELGKIDGALVTIQKTCNPITDTVKIFDGKLKLGLDLFTATLYQTQRPQISEDTILEVKRKLRRTATSETMLPMQQSDANERTALLPPTHQSSIDAAQV